MYEKAGSDTSHVSIMDSPARIWKRARLRSRIFFILAILVVIALAGGAFTLVSTYRLYTSFMAITEIYRTSLTTAQQLETELALQKGIVSSYLVDENPEWLTQLTQYEESFRDLLSRARRAAQDPEEMRYLSLMDSEYAQYRAIRRDVVGFCQQGQREEALRLLRQAHTRYDALHELCKQYRDGQERRIEEARQRFTGRVKTITTAALIAMPGVAGMGMLLAYILLTQVLEPIRKLALEEPDAIDGTAVDEVKALRRRVKGLIKDKDQTHSQLEQSRERLARSEKWAMVGKLAAGVAHSIRNPLTSVKMRMFSMERTLELSPTQREDFEVIAQEIRHIDTIVRNFLAFSRPPTLKMQKIGLSTVVDMALEIMYPRLASYGVSVEIDRKEMLPEVQADPDQLKEVLVNLMINACEAMGPGGMIVLSEEVVVLEDTGRAAVIRVSDNGPGIPQSILDKVFQPFFSTKEEGTGLGLSIAARIVEEHGGWLDVSSKEGEGATFIITLPA